MAVENRAYRTGRGPYPRFDGAVRDEPPIGDLFRQLSDDASRLIRQEIALGKAELKETATGLGKDAAKVGAAAGLALMGALAGVAFLIVALGDLLNNYWLSALIVSAVLLMTAVVIGKGAVNDIRSREMKPTQTIRTLQADAAWAKREAATVKRDWKS